MHVYAALLVRNPPDGPGGGGASASRPVAFVQISERICGVMEDCDIDLGIFGLAVASHMLSSAQGGRLCCGMLCHLLDVPIMSRSSTTHTDRPLSKGLPGSFYFVHRTTPIAGSSSAKAATTVEKF